jgi:Gpi18-like mannosyltransferase
MNHLDQLTLTERLSKFTAAFFLIGIGIRLVGAGVISKDMQSFLTPWYQAIAALDWPAALRGEFSNSSPPYLYLLTLVAKANVPVRPVVAIKLLSVLFDVVNAFLIYRIVGLRAEGRTLPLLAAGLFLCLPTLAMHSAAWGQTDAGYACFILAPSTSFSSTGRYRPWPSSGSRSRSKPNPSC